MQVLTSVSNREGSNSWLTAIAPSLPKNSKWFTDISFFFILSHNYEIWLSYNQIRCLQFSFPVNAVCFCNTWTKKTTKKLFVSFFSEVPYFDRITMQEYPESECNPLQVPKLTLDSETEVGRSKKIIVQREHFTTSITYVREIRL